jgi:beta-lactamase superfamily II metal-dependent hydrolase
MSAPATDTGPQFGIEMLPAGHGDGLLISYSDGSRSRAILVDGGPYYSYSMLRDRLLQGVDELQLMVATHVDADHIEGLVLLLRDPALKINVRDCWFNGWRQLKDASGMLDGVAGDYLSVMLADRGIPLNSAFDGSSVTRSLGVFPTLAMPGALDITVLSPTRYQLARLLSRWEDDVEEAGLKPGSPVEARKHLEESRKFGRGRFLAAFNLDELAEEAAKTDRSPVNGSSIALLLEYNDKRILLAADTPPTLLEESLKELIRKRGGVRLRLDAFKVAHHGSKGSLTNSLLDLIECQRYLISTNGKYFGHPDDEAIARIIRHGARDISLYFNYKPDESRFWDDTKLQARERFRVVYPQGDHPGLILNLL